jgi:RNA polymerase sigma factor (TIGR02999 family)
MADVTQILEAVQKGDAKAAAELFPLVYAELHQLAGQKMAREVPGHTLQPTELVHEAWLRLGGDKKKEWHNRAHFFGAAAEAMRRILVDRARAKKRQKRGGDWQRVDLEEVQIVSPIPDEELLALDEALGKLEGLDSKAAELVKLCFFVDLTQEQAAKELGVSLSTVERTWAYARAWLFREVKANLSLRK